MLKHQLQQDLKQAMKAKDEITVSTLRMLNAALKNAEIAGERKALTEEQILQLVKREVKTRQDAVTDYAKGGRQDLVQKETAEIAVLKKYLPQMMSEADTAALVDRVLRELGVDRRDPSTAAQDDAARHFGKVMKAVIAAASGKADGQLVSKLVKEKLK